MNGEKVNGGRFQDMKKFVRYADGAKMYSMGKTKFVVEISGPGQLAGFGSALAKFHSYPGRALAVIRSTEESDEITVKGKTVSIQVVICQVVTLPGTSHYRHQWNEISAVTIPGRCAQPLTILPDGFISQTEMTSCGLNGVFLLVENLKEKSSSIPLQLLAKNEKILILANRISIMDTYY